jgi:formylglycine-generating enzyme required for sulfatase activity
MKAIAAMPEAPFFLQDAAAGYWVSREPVTPLACDQLLGLAETPRDKLAEKFQLTQPTKPYTDMTFGMGKRGYPAISMTHYAARMYCKWLSAKTGRYYRLPTEAEWEYACRAGTTTGVYFGDGGAWGTSYAWTAENSRYQSHPVGLLLPNRYGIYDMHGNAREWCLDLFAHYPAPLGGVVYQDDRVTQNINSGDLRPSRGGFFLVPWEDSRSAKRYYTSQNLKLLGGGFRIARTLPPRGPAEQP